MLQGDTWNRLPSVSCKEGPEGEEREREERLEVGGSVQRDKGGVAAWRDWKKGEDPRQEESPSCVAQAEGGGRICRRDRAGNGTGKRGGFFWRCLGRTRRRGVSRGGWRA